MAGLSNQNLIIIAHATEESKYFLELLAKRTATIILLTKIDNPNIHTIFHELCIKLNVVVLALDENNTNDEKYVLKQRSKEIINSVIKNNKFEKILTLEDEDIQNKRLFEFVYSMKLDNHYTYGKKKDNTRCSLFEKIMNLYKIEDNKYVEIDGLRKYLFK
uniref:Uncharacterized protein n=1 Tax=viral metagenome TaxID=1070528 RepID=A0A6C0E0C5_9ZZZZ